MHYSDLYLSRKSVLVRATTDQFSSYTLINILHAFGSYVVFIYQQEEKSTVLLRCVSVKSNRGEVRVPNNIEHYTLYC